MVRGMAVPEIIPIAHEPDYRTSTIGRFSDGQFLASITYAFPNGFTMGDGWEEHKRLLVVLHKFDHGGHHQESDIWCAGTWAEQMKRPLDEDSVVARAEARLTANLAALAEREYCNIAIRPFRLTVGGVLFGLVTECHDDDGDGEDDWAELYPDGLGFTSPWNGEYDT
jgi:formate hydrogenlyase regulatory protein HycA